MVIDKILNNNVIVSIDENNQEVIVMGLGIGYGKKTGMNVDLDKIDKVFRLSDEVEAKYAIGILEVIPVEILGLTSDIIKYAKTLVGKPIDDIIYITLSDHINSSLDRYKEGVSLKNALLWDIKQFYREEYRIGIYALEKINETYDVSLLDDEAGFIALHFVNAQLDKTVDNVMQLTRIMQDITNIIKYNFQIELDEDSIHYYRYINHIKSFAQRLLTGTIYDGEDDLEILSLITKKYGNSHNCALKVGDYLRKQFDYKISSEEVMYLTVHIQRLVYKK